LPVGQGAPKTDLGGFGDGLKEREEKEAGLVLRKEEEKENAGHTDMCRPTGRQTKEVGHGEKEKKGKVSRL
jgi:hypothetical protein